MTEATITTAAALPAELRAELVARREAGTTLAELKKAFPQVAPNVIREVLPPLPKPTAEAKPRRTRKAPAKATETPTTTKGARASRQFASSQAKGKAQPKPATNGGTTDKERLELARKVVAARDNDGLSWLKIGAKFKLADNASTAKAGAARARTLYRSIKGADASTAALPKPAK